MSGADLLTDVRMANMAKEERQKKCCQSFPSDTPEGAAVMETLKMPIAGCLRWISSNLSSILLYLLLTTANTELTRGLCGLEERSCLQTVLQPILMR